MKFLINLFHHLGSLNFAIILIAITALMVVAGTVIESQTNSHQYAAHYTYENPFFLVLLSFYFINILFSALRRWPFQKKHIPFLITHLGLLMVIGGVILKNLYGLQGSLSLIEGTANNLVALPNSYCLRVESLNPANPLKNEQFFYNLKGKALISDYPCKELKINCKGLYQSVDQYYRSWIFDKEAIIQGLTPFAFEKIDGQPNRKLIPSTKVNFTSASPTWNIYAFKTDLEEEVLQKLLIENGTLDFFLAKQKKPYTFPLKELLKGIDLDGYHFKANLKLMEQDDEDISLTIEIYYRNELIHLRTLYLTETKSLKEDQKQFSLLHRPYKVILNLSPTLVFFQNANFETTIWSMAPQGILTKHVYPSQNLNSLIAYGEGFGGYTQRYPLKIFSEGLEEAKERILLGQLENLPIDIHQLPPPLKKLYEVIPQSDSKTFGQTLVSFLKQWHEQSDLFFIPDSSFEVMLDRLQFSQDEIRSLSWIIQTFLSLEQSAQITHEASLRSFLKSQPQDLLQGGGEFETDSDLLVQLGQQILKFPHLLSDLPQYSKAELLSAYFLTYGISYQSLKSILDENDAEKLLKKVIDLESPLRMVFKSSIQGIRPEDQNSIIHLEIVEDGKKQSIALPYNKAPSGLSWPTLSQKYLLRFEPQQKTLPYRVRLHRAWQDNYLNTNQALSYESLLTLEKDDKTTAQAHLKMNHVHETSEGHRFYLANVTDSESTAKRVHLIINYDPVKYWLTYPGGLILSCGIFLFLLSLRKNR